MFGVFVKSIVQLNLEQNFQECGVKISKNLATLRFDEDSDLTMSEAKKKKSANENYYETKH